MKSERATRFLANRLETLRSNLSSLKKLESNFHRIDGGMAYFFEIETSQLAVSSKASQKKCTLFKLM